MTELLFVDTLRELEESLWRPGTRFDRAHMDGTLHADFFEFGRSGRTYTRDQCLDAAPAPFAATLHDFAVHPVVDGVAQATYVSEVHHGDDPTEYANRSSLWVREGDRWRLRFHQGTPVER
jgi:hypothetical protein